MDISDAVRNLIADAFVDAIDGGSGAGTIEIRTGTKPANTAASDSGTLLATLTFSDPAFGSAASGVATANAITGDSSIDATGTAGHFRIKTSAGTVVAQGTVGTSGADMNFNSLAFVSGGTVNISSMTVTAPASN